MTNEIAKNETKELKVTAADYQAGNEEIDASDVLIPRVLLCQGLSVAVNERKALQGDFIRSTTGQVLANPDHPLTFIPLSFNKTWVNKELVGKKYEFRSIEPMTALNQDLPWEYQKDGKQWMRVASINVFALLPDDIELEQKALENLAKTGELPNPETALMPVLVSFQSSSYKAGKAVVTHFARCKSYNLPGYAGKMTLGCNQTTNDLGTFFVMDVKSSGSTPSLMFPTCKKWYEVIAQGKAKVDNSDLETEVTNTSARPSVSPEDAPF